jgi:hypothetical protein
MRLLFFAAIYALQIALTFPNFQATCKGPHPPSGYVLYFAHHILDVFMFWSPLFIQTRMEAMIHLALLLLVLIHWFVNKNQCVLSQKMNIYCGLPTGTWLDSIKNRLGLREYLGDYYLFGWGVLLGAYDVYLLSRSGRSP